MSIAANTSVTNKENNIVDPDTLEFSSAVRSVEEAHEIFKRMESDNKDRNGKAADIMKLYNDTPPFTRSELKKAGQGWRHNRSTGFFSSQVKRIMPAYKQSVDTAKVLSSSKLDGIGPDVDCKNQTFQTQITSTIRRWSGWDNLISLIILEDCVFGYCAACRTSQYEWRPKFYREDEILFPENCPQDAKDVPFFGIREDFMIHDLAHLLRDPEASLAAGWNIDNLVDSINKAQPAKQIDSNNPRKMEDIVRESTIGLSYTSGVKVIRTARLIIREPATGKISNFLMDRDSGKPLMIVINQFESMEECLSIFTIEVGNGKVHGSKGLGRILYNTAMSIEQTRNQAADNFALAGLVLVQTKNKSKTFPMITVLYPMAIIPEAYEVMTAKIDVNVDDFVSLDKYMTALAQYQAGQFIPQASVDQPNDKGDNKQTASFVNYMASIEQQIREGVLSRFYAQILAMVFQMQRKICSKDNIKQAMAYLQWKNDTTNPSFTTQIWDFLVYIGKKVIGRDALPRPMPSVDDLDAVKCIVAMMGEGLSPEEIFELANTPPQEVTQDLTAMRKQGIASVMAKYKGDPDVDQMKLKMLDISSDLSYKDAETLIIPKDDNTIKANNVRWQLVEWTSLMAGEPVPVGPQDVDTIHMDTMQQKGKELIPPPAGTPKDALALIENVLKHYDEHINGALMKGAKPEQLKPYTDFSKMAHSEIDKVKNTPVPGAVAPPPAGGMPLVSAGMPPMADQTDLPAPPTELAPISTPGKGDMERTMPSVPTPPVAGNLPLSKGPVRI